MPQAVAVRMSAGGRVRVWLGAVLALLLSAEPVSAQVGVGPSGSPGYSQAIKVPPGIAGMQPNLGLSFAGGGVNGPLGYGWSLQGLSMITRCAGILASDGAPRAVQYKPSDKLCLDGQRLIQTNALGVPVAASPAANGALNDAQGTSEPSFTEYRTEKDSYSRIRAYGAAGGDVNNGAAYFRVWTKSGQVYDYGATPSGNTRSNALVRAKNGAGGDTVAVAWAVNRISDTLGNYIDFFYAQRDVAWGTGPTAGSPRSGHEWGLFEVQYTGNAQQGPTNKLVLEYEDRPAGQDRSEAYHQGSKNISVWRLKAVRSYVNWPGASLGFTTSGALVVPPANAIKVNTVKLAYDLSPTTQRSLVSSITECAGKQESLCQQPVKFSYSAPAAVLGESYLASPSSTGFETLVMRDLTGKYGVINADFYGEGRQSLLRWGDTPADNQLWRSNGDGTFSRDYGFNITTQNLYKSDSCYYTQVMDLNGDGLPDLLRYSGPKSLGGKACTDSGPVLVFINNGNGTFTQKPWNGPALERAESAPIKECEPLSATSASASSNVGPAVNGGSNEPLAQRCTTVGYRRGANFFIVDVDGDGFPDILTTERAEFMIDVSAQMCPTSGCTKYWHAKPDGSYEQLATNLKDTTLYVSPNVSPGIGQPKNLVDVDGDGLVDIVGLTVKYGTAAAYRNNGDGNFSAIGAATTCDLPGDFNGDGRADCLSIAADALPAGNTLNIAQGGGAFEKTASFNLTGPGNALGVASGTVPATFGALIADFNGDGRSDVLRWASDASQNSLYLSNGDGTFRGSSGFNFGSVTLKDTTDGKADFLVGDFTGHGNVEILRFVANPYVPPAGGGDPCNPTIPVSKGDGGASTDQKGPIDPCTAGTSSTTSTGQTGLALVLGSTYNELFVRQDQRPADLLLRVTSPTGLQTRLSYTSVSNPKQGMASDGSLINLGAARYSSGRVAGQNIFPKADVAFPMNIVATVEADTGIAGSTLRTEYAYKGLRVATNGRGLLGFMQVNQQNPAPDGSQINVLTDYFQDHPYTGVAAVSQTFRGPLGTTASRLSRSTNGYCEGTANASGVQINSGGVAPTPCASSALVQRPYLAQSLEEGWDVNGEALPVVRKTSTYNSDGDPLTITIQTTGTSAGQSQTFTKQVSNSYETADSSCAADNKTCSWTLGRLKRATVSNTVPNLLPSLTASAGSNANATAIAGTLTLPSSATAELTSSLAFNNAALNVLSTAKATLANNGAAALTLSAINASSVTGTGFSFQSTDCSASLAAKGSCSITVGFTPTVAGSATGKLTINTALGSRETALTGSTASASTLSASVGRVIFADTVINQSSDSASLTLTNGSTAVTGLSIVPPAGFSVINSNCGSSLAASATCSFALRFTPTAVQAYTGNVNITASGGASATVALNGNGVNAAASTLSVSAGRVIFADTVINQSSDSASLTLTNGSTAVTGLSIVPPAGFSVISSNCGSSLAASATCSFALRFTPTAVQAYTGNVSITASGGASATVALNGNGINGAASVSLDHVSPASSGTVIPAYSTTTLAVYYKNTGTGPATLSSTSTSAGTVFYNADGSGGTCAPGRSLAAGQKCFLLQGWGGSAGTVNATLTANFGSTTINTPLSAVQKTLDVSASNLGASTATTLDQVLTIANNTPAAFQFGSPRVRFGTVSGGGSWNIQADSCPAVLVPGSNCAITVRYTAGAAGSASVLASVYGQFEWADLIDGGSQRSGLYRGIADVQAMSLSAVSLAPAASLSVSPNSLNFADTPTNQTRDSGTVTLTNGAASVTGLTIAPPSGYSVISSTCGSSLAPSASCSFAVRFAPTAVQAYSGSVAITANGGAVSTAVTVTGKGAGVPKLDAVTASPFSAGTTLTPYAASGGHITFKNSGTANVSITGAPSVTGGGSAYTTAGDNSWCGSGAVIAPGATCLVYVYWSSAPGSYSGLLSVPSNGGTPSVTVNATYTGALSFSGADFGNVTVNTTADRTITVTNTAAFSARSVSVNALSAPFSVVGNNCGATLAAGASCQVTVRFSPTAASGANASLRIDGLYNQVYSQNYEAAQAGNLMPYTASLSGAGVPAAQALAVSLNPSSVSTQVSGTAQATASVTATPTGGVAPFTYRWTVQTVNSGLGKVFSGATTSTAVLAVAPLVVCDSGNVDFLLTVTDSVGTSASATIEMNVDSISSGKQMCSLVPRQPTPGDVGNSSASPSASTQAGSKQ